MSALFHLIASESHGGGGSSPLVRILLFGGAGAAIAILVQRSRLKKAQARVIVRRVPEDGRVELDRLPEAHSMSVGVRVSPDELGTVTLIESAT